MNNSRGLAAASPRHRRHRRLRDDGCWRGGCEIARRHHQTTLVGVKCRECRAAVGVTHCQPNSFGPTLGTRARASAIGYSFDLCRWIRIRAKMYGGLYLSERKVTPSQLIFICWGTEKMGTNERTRCFEFFKRPFQYNKFTLVKRNDSYVSLPTCPTLNQTPSTSLFRRIAVRNKTLQDSITKQFFKPT